MSPLQSAELTTKVHHCVGQVSYHYLTTTNYMLTTVHHFVVTVGAGF